MKTIISTLCFVLVSYFTFSQEILTNNTIIQLVNLKMGSSIIINKIETSKNRFNVTTDSLIWLKSQNVPDDVISSMIKAASNVNNAITDSNDPSQYHSSGIYYYKLENTVSTMSELEPAVVSQNRTRGLWGYAFTGGISKASQNAVLPRPNAHFQISDLQPTFYFYFNAHQENLTTASGSFVGDAFGKATSPNEFILIKAQKKGDEREFPMNSMNISGQQSGISSKNEVSFEIQKISDGIYKVYFTKPLSSGEYAFMYAGMIAGSSGTSTLFDFGIQKNK